MIVAFDLDDTLYSEITYVHSGMRAVSEYVARHSSHNQDELLSFMLDDLAKNGRGRTFNHLLTHFNLSAFKTKELLSVYRKHKPHIELHEEARLVLESLCKTAEPLYLVTDGNLIVQRGKIKALGLNRYFKKTFPSRQFGISAEKPSLICFEHILKLENKDWSELLYVGDNPKKDFVSLNKMGAMTCRLLQGHFINHSAEKAFDAQHSFHNIKDWYSWYKTSYDHA